MSRTFSPSSPPTLKSQWLQYLLIYYTWGVDYSLKAAVLRLHTLCLTNLISPLHTVSRCYSIPLDTTSLDSDDRSRNSSLMKKLTSWWFCQVQQEPDGSASGRVGVGVMLAGVTVLQHVEPMIRKKYCFFAPACSCLACIVSKTGLKKRRKSRAAIGPPSSPSQIEADL
jgi:hypothetical protein